MAAVCCMRSDSKLPGLLMSRYGIATNSISDTFHMQYWTRCSAIAERPRCRVRYSFRQK